MTTSEVEVAKGRGDSLHFAPRPPSRRNGSQVADRSLSYRKPQPSSWSCDEEARPDGVTERCLTCESGR